MVWSITRSIWLSTSPRNTYHSKVRALRCQSISFHGQFDRKMCHIRNRIYRCGNHDIHVEFCSIVKRSPRFRNRRGRKRCRRVHSKPDWDCAARCGRNCQHAGSFGSPTHHRRVRYQCVHSCFCVFFLPSFWLKSLQVFLKEEEDLAGFSIYGVISLCFSYVIKLPTAYPIVLLLPHYIRSFRAFMQTT
jgi:hypothetical protein